ncbi:hypothetical protein NL676_017962 [Syzygium grande]|nr:hypothetical protein NL676_017962 [Syzygium grande]
MKTLGETVAALLAAGEAVKVVFPTAREAASPDLAKAFTVVGEAASFATSSCWRGCNGLAKGFQGRGQGRLATSSESHCHCEQDSLVGSDENFCRHARGW